MGVDIMELPRTEKGNKYAVVFQDFFSKWPMVFPVFDQKAIHLARLLVDEIVPRLECQKHFCPTEGHQSVVPSNA